MAAGLPNSKGSSPASTLSGRNRILKRPHSTGSVCGGRARYTEWMAQGLGAKVPARVCTDAQTVCGVGCGHVHRSERQQHNVPHSHVRRHPATVCDLHPEKQEPGRGEGSPKRCNSLTTTPASTFTSPPVTPLNHPHHGTPPHPSCHPHTCRSAYASHHHHLLQKLKNPVD